MGGIYLRSKGAKARCSCNPAQAECVWMNTSQLTTDKTASARSKQWLTDSHRSALMKRVRRRDTPPEIRVRTILSEIGARYRLNVKNLPGTPDIANKTRRKAIFVHGCFWHNHDLCGRGRIPIRNAQRWTDKLAANVARDRQKEAALRLLGFDVLVLWECELGDVDALRRRLRKFWNTRAL